MPALTIPNTFSANTTALSAEVNANFNAIATLLNSTKLDNTNVQTGGLATANYADDSVTKAKIASDVVDGSTLEQAVGGELRIKDAGVSLAKLAAAVAQALLPSGALVAYGGTAAPSGYLLCDASAVSRTTYSALFAAIGTAFGSGDGSTTFNLPDGRGTFLRGVDGARGLDPDAATRTAMASGGNTGNNVGSIQDSAYQQHSHSVSYTNGVSGGSARLLGTALGGGTQNGTSSTTVLGVGSTTETRPVNMYVNFIIKT